MTLLRWAFRFVVASVTLTLMGTALYGAVALPDGAPGAVRFAAAEVERAAAATSGQTQIRIEISNKGEPQSFRIERQGETIRVIGADAAGAMYGGLEVAEAIRLGTLAELKTGETKPFVSQRGIKFNIPLDLRTPSYSDNSDSAQANIPEMWSLVFWQEFFDEMARHRFNVLSLWSLNPFPSIVKVPEYPEVALADVLRGRRTFFDDSFSHSGTGMFRSEFMEGAEVVKKMSIEEKMDFWREVMRRARDRGIEVYWFTWNTFLHSEEGKHGLSRKRPDTNLVNYFRASVRETVKAYPLLAGMGITAGEHMENPLGGLSKEEWLWQTYGEGIRDALKDEPRRKFRLIHRFHMTGLEETARAWKDYPGPFDFSYKYAVAHMYGLTNPPFIQPLLPELSPSRRTWLTVRNDDIYSFRWGDPQYARDFMRALPGPDKVAGFYMGPDGYCWGREAMDLEPETPRQLVMQKQWFSFMLWGRLSFDPTLSDGFFERVLRTRFPGADAKELLAAWSAASRVFPEITRFNWGNIDLKWLPEACLSHPRHKGFYTVRHFMEGETMPGSGNLTIREWRQNLARKLPMAGHTPLEVAASLQAHAQAALKGAGRLQRAAADHRELRLTLGDIEAFGHIGLYYAEKIRGACELALFDSSGESARREAAIQHLEKATDHWRGYANVYARQYRQPLLYNRVGVVDIPAFTEKAAADIAIARAWQPGTLGAPPAPRKAGSKYGQ